MPIEPGTHVKKVRMFSPIDPNTCCEFFGVFNAGKGMKVSDLSPDLIANARGREVARVKAGGKISISINLTERNMLNHGYVACVKDKD